MCKKTNGLIIFFLLHYTILLMVTILLRVSSLNKTFNCFYCDNFLCGKQTFHIASI